MRKLLEDRKIIKGVSLRQSINDAFDRECVRIGRPMSHIIEDLLIEWLKKQIGSDENEQL